MKLIAAFLAPFMMAASSLDAEPRFAIVVHGGAGSAPSKTEEARNIAKHDGLKRALEAGRDILAGGGTSLDAVEAVVRLLEDDPAFNAGKGAVLNARGEAELDASIMEGRTLQCGAVAGATRTKNPVAVARLVMERTRHVLLAGGGADTFAEEAGAGLVERDYFITDHERARLERVKKKDKTSASGGNDRGSHLGTVGCVALDTHGNLAAATSTGGLVNKRVGRVGDSPVVGAGTYADNGTCAVSGTGIGEEFIRHAVAYDVSARMRYAGQPLAEAVEDILTNTVKPGTAGIIAVDRDGHIVIDFNTEGMASAAADSDGRFEVHWPRGLPE